MLGPIPCLTRFGRGSPAATEFEPLHRERGLAEGYDAPDSTWILLGRTPLDSVLLALAERRAVSRCQPASDRGAGLSNARSGRTSLRRFGDRLDPDSAIPAGDGPDRRRTDWRVFFPGFEHVEPIQLGDYLMDRYEVTNRDSSALWTAAGTGAGVLGRALVKDGRPIPWEQAMAIMTDRTGRTGAFHLGGRRVPGRQENHPVGGVSWFEAMAFARFAGSRCPPWPTGTVQPAYATAPGSSRPAIFPAMERSPSAVPGVSAPSVHTTWPATCGSGA